MKKDYLRMATRRKKSSDCYALACMTNDEELVFIRVFSASKKLQTALQKEIQSLTDALAGEGISPDAIQITDDTESTKVSWDGGDSYFIYYFSDVCLE